MHKVRKLIILIIMSCSVYFIYQQTKNSVINITNIGDNLAVGINPYGIKEYSYSDYFKEELNEKSKKININNEFAKKDLSLNTLLEYIKNNPKLKKTLTESNILILNVGYNDLVYKLSLKDNINQFELDKIIREISDNYNNLLKEIKKYYKREIIVIGYYSSNKDEYYINKGIRKLNEVLSSSDEIEYIDTYNLLANREKYFPNPQFNYPNRLGYQAISKKIIEKTLDN